MTAALVTLVVLNLLALVIATDSKRRDRAHAQAMHPSNWGEVVEVTDAVAVPLICPVCLKQFTVAYLSESGGTIGGWIDIKRHDCTKEGAA